MSPISRAMFPALLGLALGATRLAAQIDYRNLDDERPVGTEDAYPVEHYAFEVLAPLTFATTGGTQQYLLAPEVEYGVLPNTQVGVKLPLAVSAADGSSDAGLGGIAAYALYNFNTESGTLPAFALRSDVSFPVGSLAGDGVRFTLKAIATRSWGLWRAHLNLLGSSGSNDDLGIDALPRWAATVAVDRTFFRQSLLLIGEAAVFEQSTDSPTQATAALGLRWQWTPTLVLDTGVSTRLTATGPDFTITLGFTHVLAFRGLMPRYAPLEVPHATHQ